MLLCIYLWQELEESDAWIREKSSILGAQGFGKDLTSVLKLIQKHKTLAGELLAHRSLLQVRRFLWVFLGVFCFILQILFIELKIYRNTALLFRFDANYLVEFSGIECHEV